jgi:hypothetical protein
MNWLPCGCFDKLFVCLQQICYLKKSLQKAKKEAKNCFCTRNIDRNGKKSSLPEKIAKDVEEVTSRVLRVPKKSRDAVHFSLNCLIIIKTV